MSRRLEEWNGSSEEDAARAVIGLCGSRAWARCLARSRPLADRDLFLRTAQDCASRLTEADWLEAFAAHPAIGDRNAAGAAADEQSGVRGASGETLEALAKANRDYKERFGWIFLVCASGKSAVEMLSLCRARLHNDRATELAVAAAEQRKITRLRIEKWLS